uniref:Uncharacterized protein n=1 Tax=Panagrolaimus sp. JU765 TaxID=591449 RepID=A0AC34QX65_9BILA
MDGETFRAFTSYLESVSGPSLSNGNLPMQQFLPNPYAPNMNPNLNNQQLLCLLLQANQANLPQMNPIYQQLMNQSGSTTITHRVNPAYSYPMTTQTPQLSSSLPTHPGIIHNTQISQNRNSISPQSDDGMNRKRRHDKAPPTHSPSKSPSLPVKENSQPRVESLKQQSEIMAAADSPLRHHPAFLPKPDRDVFKVEFLTLFYLSGLQGFAAAAAASEESNGTTDSVPNVTMSDVHHLIEEVVRSDA